MPGRWGMWGSVGCGALWVGPVHTTAEPLCGDVVQVLTL